MRGTPGSRCAVVSFLDTPPKSESCNIRLAMRLNVLSVRESEETDVMMELKLKVDAVAFC